METSRSSSLTEETSPSLKKDDENVHEFNFMGFKIFVGRNALSNEKLVADHKKMHKKCIWLHAANSKGAHVILCVAGKVAVNSELDEVVLRRAAGLASKFSHLKELRVNWAELQDVYKPMEDVVGYWKTWKTDRVIEL